MRVTQLLGIGFLAAALAGPVRADGRSLPARHAKAGVTCFDCHQKEKPTDGATGSTCMDCHGDLPAMAVLTKGLPVNPHMALKAPHPGPFACTDCHRQHQPPVVKCLECHPKFKLSAK